MIIYLVNESTVVSDTEAWNIAWAIDYQLQYQFGRSGHRGDVRCVFTAGGGNARIPVGGRILHLLDTSDQPGALGYHDEDGNEVAFARVFCKTAKDDGDEPSEVASHEALELALDEHVNLTTPDASLRFLYAVEACDACQGNGYDVGAEEGRKTGVIVADFLRPNYFDPNTKTIEATSFTGALKGPFTLGPHGYYSYIDLTNVAAGWQQKVGSERKKPVVDPDDRNRVTRRRAPQPQELHANFGALSVPHGEFTDERI